MKLHLPKGIRQAILACITIAATAGTSAYGAGWNIPTVGDFNAGPFEFSFDYTTAATADTILASYCGTGDQTEHSWCKFILGADGSLKLVRTNNDGDALTTIGTIRNTSVFTDGGQNYTLQEGTTYTVKYLGGGNDHAAADLYIGDDKVASFTNGSFNMNGSAPAPLFLNINASYNAGANAATWNATSGDSANIAYTNDGAWNISGGSQSGNLENQRPDVVFGAADNLVKNVTVSDSFMADGITINDNYTFTGSNSALIDAHSTISVADGKTMTLAGTGALKAGVVEGAVEIAKDATWAINPGAIDISTVTGEGNLAFDNGKAILGYGTSTKLTGKLIIKTGGELRLGVDGNTAGNGSVDLSSLSGGIELAGGTLSTRFMSGEIGDISVTADSVLNPVDINSYTENGQTRLYQLGIGTLDMGANLTVKTGWKANIDVEHITGTGNLTFTNESGDGIGRDLYIGSVAGYTGKLIVDHVKNDNGSDKTGGNINTGRLHVTIGEGESLSADQLAVNTSNGSIELDGSGTFKVAADGSIAKGSWKTQRTEGSGDSATTIVEDHTGEKGSFASTWTGTAELNGTTLNNADLNTYGNSASKVKLQNVNGSIAAGEVAPTLVVAGGSSGIVLTGDTTFTALTFEGGTLTATGEATLTLNAVSIDLTKYTTEALEYTLVSAGTLNLGANVDLSALGGTVDGYTATVQKSGNSLVLTFALPDAGKSLLVEDAELDLDARVLALTVDGNLTGLSSVDLTLSDAALQEITGKYGDVSLELRADDGTFYTVGDTNVIGNVSFYNGAYVGEGNGMYKVEYIPEPATATLSLLALAGLAARRRRK